MTFNNTYWEKYTGTVSEINLFPLLVILEVLQGPHCERNHINVTCLIKIYQVNIGNYISVVNSGQYVIINMIHLWIYSKLFEYSHVTIFSFFNAIFYFLSHHSLLYYKYHLQKESYHLKKPCHTDYIDRIFFYPM